MKKVLSVGHSKDHKMILHLFGQDIEPLARNVPEAIERINSGLYRGFFMQGLRIDPAGHDIPIPTLRERKDPFKHGLYLAYFAIHTGKTPTLVYTRDPQEIKVLTELQIPYIDSVHGLEADARKQWIRVFGEQ